MVEELVKNENGPNYRKDTKEITELIFQDTFNVKLGRSLIANQDISQLGVPEGTVMKPHYIYNSAGDFHIEFICDFKDKEPLSDYNNAKTTSKKGNVNVVKIYGNPMYQLLKDEVIVFDWWNEA